MKPNVGELVAMVRSMLSQGVGGGGGSTALLNNVLQRVETARKNPAGEVSPSDVSILAAHLYRGMTSAPSSSSTSSSSKGFFGFFSSSSSSSAHDDALPTQPQPTAGSHLRRLRDKHVIVSMGKQGVAWVCPRSAIQALSPTDTLRHTGSSAGQSGHSSRTVVDASTGRAVATIDDHTAFLHIPAAEIPCASDASVVLNSSGAGDTMTAAMVHSLLSGVGDQGITSRGLQRALQAAAQSMCSKHAVPEDLKLSPL